MMDEGSWSRGLSGDGTGEVRLGGGLDRSDRGRGRLQSGHHSGPVMSDVEGRLPRLGNLW